MKSLLSALKGVVLQALVKINFTDIILGALQGFTGIWGKLISLFARPVLSRFEKNIDDAITTSESEEKSDAVIDQTKDSHITQITQAKTDEETDAAFRSSLR